MQLFQIEQRLRAGRPAALIGALASAPVTSSPVEWILVESDARAPLSTLKNTELALAKLHDTLPEPLPNAHRCPGVGGFPCDIQSDGLSELLERARAGACGSTCVVVRNVEAADDASLELFRHLVLQAATLAIPIFFHFESESPSGKAKNLLDAIKLVEGERALVELVGPQWGDWGCPVFRASARSEGFETDTHLPRGFG